jgi:hypothetical protein
MREPGQGCPDALGADPAEAGGYPCKDAFIAGIGKSLPILTRAEAVWAFFQGAKILCKA